ncbi:MAG: S1C family serine protease [Alphaproteobacteria bacterium]|jgi:S1-C subfamily serine protease|nr:S1C family serine protease [Alphaproteobacteria bacterium]
MDELEDRLGPDIPSIAQPKPEELAYDLDGKLSSVLSLRTSIPDDAFTAGTLGTERGGSGALIREDGLVLTIGYLITEAESIWLFDSNNRAVPAHTVGYDQESGFGLVQALQPLDLPALELGNSGNLRTGDPVVMAGCGGRAHAVSSQIVARREFAGYWEYLLDNAIFTAPPHPLWGGAALIGADGTLRGIGSLFVQQAREGGTPIDVNMVVPIDLLKPIMAELLQFGRTRKPPRPWLGMLTTEVDDRIVVAGVVDGGPAQDADIQLGDIILGIGGKQVADMASMFRHVWSMGEAGVEIPLDLQREGDAFQIHVRSISRSDRLKAPKLH